MLYQYDNLLYSRQSVIDRRGNRAGLLIYEGKSTSLSHFQLTETPTIFMPCFNTCFRPEGKNAPLSCHSLIRYWMSNMASDAKASFSSKVEYRAVIRYLYLKGKTDQEIHCELINVYGSSAPSYAQVKFWVGEFKRGRTSSEDETGLDAHQMPPMKKCVTKYGIWCTLIGELRWKKQRMHYTFHMVAFQQFYMIAWVCAS